MRPRFIVLVIALTLSSIQPLMAASPSYSLADKPNERAFWRSSYMPVIPAKERTPQEVRYRVTYSDAIAARLGVVDGKARLFRYDLDNSHNNGRAIEGALSGNGVKFRLSW